MAFVKACIFLVWFINLKMYQGTPLTKTQGIPLTSAEDTLLIRNQGTPLLNHGSPVFVQLGNGTLIKGRCLVETIAFQQRKVSQFLGIPFAQAPVGPLRFRAPIELDFNRPDIVDAQQFGPICFQPVFTSTLEPQWYDPNSMQMSENCLNLNIWVPNEPNPDRKLPVLVFIFGQDFVYGSSNRPDFNGKLLASLQNVVVVTINHRLGPFGYLFTNETKMGQSGDDTFLNNQSENEASVSTDQSENEARSIDQSQANAGLLDQLAALKWINRYITWFGGDKDNVTLVGQGTGGGVSAGLHALSSAGQSYFKRLVLTNGVPTTINQGHFLTNQQRALANTMELAQKVNCTIGLATNSIGAAESRDHHSNLLTEKIVECLRQVEPEVLVEQSKFSDNFMDFPWVPVIDGQLVKGQSPLDNGQLAGIDLMLGISLQEIMGSIMDYMDSLAENQNCGRNLYNPENLTQIFQKFFPDFGSNDQHFQMINDLYENRTFDDQSVFVQMVSDAFFFCPTIDFAQKMTEQNASVYFYMFSHQQNPPNFKKLDSDSDSYQSYPTEIPYLFGKPLLDVETHRSGFNQQSAEAILISLRFMQILGDFARHGIPGIGRQFFESTISFEWNEYGREQWYHVILGLVQHKARRFKERECQFWNQDFQKRGFGQFA